MLVEAASNGDGGCGGVVEVIVVMEAMKGMLVMVRGRGGFSGSGRESWRW